MSLVRFLVIVTLVTIACQVSVSAHELERTAIFVTFNDDGTYLIDVVNDPDWLLARVEPFSGLPLSRMLDPGPRDERLVILTETFQEKVNLYFDGERVQVVAEYIPPDPNLNDNPDSPPLATMRLRGRVPDGTEVFQWSYPLVIDPYPMLIRANDEEYMTSWVDGNFDSELFELAAIRPPTPWLVAQTYLGLGFTQILPMGLEQILFVVGIFLLSTRFRPVAAQVAAFSVANIITLGLTMFGILSLPAQIVEPLMALSIAYIAIENLATSELKPWRIGLVFGFGLLHGVGFATVLQDIGLPPSRFVTAVMSFSLGVEGGQLAVIILMFMSIGWLGHKTWYRKATVVPLSLFLAAIGLYLTVVRVISSGADL